MVDIHRPMTLEDGSVVCRQWGEAIHEIRGVDDADPFPRSEWVTTGRAQHDVQLGPELMRTRSSTGRMFGSWLGGGRTTPARNWLKSLPDCAASLRPSARGDLSAEPGEINRLEGAAALDALTKGQSSGSEARTSSAASDGEST
jgi:hypothetical protein